MHVATFDGLDELPPDYDSLFENGAKQSFFLSKAWFANLATTTLSSHEQMRLVGVQSDNGKRPIALLVARTALPSMNHRSQRVFENFTTPYTTLFDLLSGSQCAQVEHAVDAIVAAIRQARPRWPVLEIKALEARGPTIDAFTRAFRNHGYAIAPYEQFGTWYVQTDGLNYGEFARSLPKGLRQLRRKLDKPVGLRFELITKGPEIAKGIAVYEELYRRSWKEAEPYPDFIGGLVRAAADSDALRLGLLYADEEPIAAQIWIVSADRATIFKVVHCEAHKRLSPGSILTTRMLEHVIDVDRVVEVDFGRGDDAYKRMWLPHRRQFCAIRAYDPRTFAGIRGAVRDVFAANAYRTLRGVWNRNISGLEKAAERLTKAGSGT